MHCPSCSAPVTAPTAACVACGCPFELVCGNCARPSATDALFCAACGTRLDTLREVVTTAATTPDAEPAGAESTADDRPDGGAASPGLEGERRNVTVMLSDLSGYTAMGERLDPEMISEIM